ncbi:MAG: C39 family peptidase [Caldilineaceae bacterium]|nr:C39 family peptidase [Caldilineaceae bacterium]
MLSVTHQQQRQRSDCLAACAAMVLDYHGVKVNYSRLLRVLRMRDIGTSFYNLRALETLGVTVLVEDGSMDQLEVCLTSGQPLIASVDTQDLLYWNGQAVLHAVVVVGSDADTISINDPAFGVAPQEIDRVNFESAWLRREYVSAVIY